MEPVFGALTVMSTTVMSATVMSATVTGGVILAHGSMGPWDEVAVGTPVPLLIAVLLLIGRRSRRVTFEDDEDLGYSGQDSFENPARDPAGEGVRESVRESVRAPVEDSVTEPAGASAESEAAAG